MTVVVILFRLTGGIGMSCCFGCLGVGAGYVGLGFKGYIFKETVKAVKAISNPWGEWWEYSRVPTARCAVHRHSRNAGPGTVTQSA
jgi:hypothetical protein